MLKYSITVDGQVQEKVIDDRLMYRPNFEEARIRIIWDILKNVYDVKILGWELGDYWKKQEINYGSNECTDH